MDDPRIDELAKTHGEDFVEALAQQIAEFPFDTDWRSPLAEGAHGHLHVSDIEHVNATNVIMAGSFWAGGTEYAFSVESGDRNGFVWRSVAPDAPIPDIEIAQTRWALAPRPDIVDRAIANGSGERLLSLWDAFLERPDVADIPRKYAYDRHVQPGHAVESHWTAKADEAGMVLVDEEQAAEVRETIRTRAREADCPAP